MKASRASHLDTWLQLIFICVCCVGRIVICCPHQLSLRWICRASTFNFHKLEFIIYVRLYTSVRHNSVHHYSCNQKLSEFISLPSSSSTWSLWPVSMYLKMFGFSTAVLIIQNGVILFQNWMLAVQGYLMLLFPNSFPICGSTLNFSIVFFIYFPWKRISANTQTCSKTKHYFIWQILFVISSLWHACGKLAHERADSKW